MMQFPKFYFLQKQTIIVVLSLCLFSCGTETNEPQKEPIVRPVKLVTIKATGNKRSNTYPAVIKAGQSAELAFQSGGLLEEIFVTEAQEIEQGAEIAKLDQRDFQNKYDSAKSQYDNAEKEYQRAVRLSKQDAIARNVLEQRKSQRDVTKAELATAEKALQDTVLRAPFSGGIAMVPVSRSENVSAGQTIVVMLSKGDLEATANIPANFVATIRQRTNRKALVILDVAPDEPISAEFKKAELEADSVSQTYPVTFSFKAPANLDILPGMNASVMLSSSSSNETSQNTVEVPLAAIATEGDKRYVWLLNPNTMAISKKEISIAEGIGEILAVSNGLVEGDKIVAAGISSLAEGMIVRPWKQ